MRVLLFVTILAAMGWPLWTAIAEARENQAPHNSSTLELALIGLGTLALFSLARQSRLRRVERLLGSNSTSLTVRYVKANDDLDRQEREATEHAA